MIAGQFLTLVMRTCGNVSTGVFWHSIVVGFPSPYEGDSKVVLRELVVSRGGEFEAQKRSYGIHGAMKIELMHKMGCGDRPHRHTEHPQDRKTVGIMGPPLEFRMGVAVILDTYVSMRRENVNFKVIGTNRCLKFLGNQDAVVEYYVAISETAFSLGQDNCQRKRRFHGRSGAISSECEGAARAFCTGHMGMIGQCCMNLLPAREGATIAIAASSFGQVEFVSPAKLVSVLDELERFHPRCSLDEVERPANGEQAGRDVYELA